MKRKTFRVFVARHYIAVEHFDILATSAKAAEKIAVKAAYKVSPDPRKEAVDNTWIADEAVNIPRLGHSAAPSKVKKILETKDGEAYYDQETRTLERQLNFQIKKPVSEIKTVDEAKQLAIDWQTWQSDKSLSYAELAEWQEYFRKLAVKFHLVREFKENGII
jgi:hypothetical protein